MHDGRWDDDNACVRRPVPHAARRALLSYLYRGAWPALLAALAAPCWRHSLSGSLKEGVGWLAAGRGVPAGGCPTLLACPGPGRAPRTPPWPWPLALEPFPFEFRVGGRAAPSTRTAPRLHQRAALPHMLGRVFECARLPAAGRSLRPTNVGWGVR